MTKERKAGLAVLTVAVLLGLAILGVVLASQINSLNYTVVFEDAKGLQAGDRVQISGVDIGVVKAVTLQTQPTRIDVRVKIYPKHAEKVRADSTAIIRNISMPNVSGQMILEVINPPTDRPSPLMAKGAQIKGMDSVLELKAWELRFKLRDGGKNMGKTLQELGQQAQALKEGLKDFANDPQVREAFAKLQEFLTKMKDKGIAAAEQLKEEWPQLKEQLAPVVKELRDLGNQYLSDEFNRMIDEIEATLKRWEELLEQTRPSTPTQTVPQ